MLLFGASNHAMHCHRSNPQDTLPVIIQMEVEVVVKADENNDDDWQEWREHKYIIK